MARKSLSPISASKVRGLRPRGYTFIEVAIVLLILGILATAATPRYLHALAERRAQMAVARLAANIRYAQRQAQNTSVPITLTFDLAANRYTAVGLPDPERPGKDLTVEFAHEHVELTQADFAGTQQTVLDIYGQATPAGSATISCGSVAATLVLDRAGRMEAM
ncbi:MAG: type II secretion system protein [Planctomycetales bacterium]|nr:type II secretion system protein [Planctomycetales bacterium]